MRIRIGVSVPGSKSRRRPYRHYKIECAACERLVEVKARGRPKYCSRVCKSVAAYMRGYEKRGWAIHRPVCHNCGRVCRGLSGTAYCHSRECLVQREAAQREVVSQSAFVKARERAVKQAMRIKESAK